MSRSFSNTDTIKMPFLCWLRGQWDTSETSKDLLIEVGPSIKVLVERLSRGLRGCIVDYSDFGGLLVTLDHCMVPEIMHLSDQPIVNVQDKLDDAHLQLLVYH